MLIHLLYYLFAGLVVMAGLCILYTPHILYAALCLMAISLGLAAIYFLQGTAFIAVIYLLIYGGGVLVMCLCALFLFRPAAHPIPKQHLVYSSFTVLLVSLCLAPLLWFSIGLRNYQDASLQNHALDTTIPSLGYEIFGPYALLLEIISMLLLLALVGALYMVRGIQRKAT